MAAISIKNVIKSYGAQQVLHGVSLDIVDGEFLILVGPSGCGKSTLLRMIAGLESINGGEVVLNDKVINDLPPRHRDIAMVFQTYALYPHMTVRKNMGFSLKLSGASKAEIDQKVLEAAKILDLELLLDRKPAALSGGQRQRVAMGRAIVRSPELFLFDEPLSNLDAKLRVLMRSEIKELHQRLKTTTVYVTHDQIEAMTMADRIVVMNHGYIEQMGSPLELYDNPESVFVAQFIGSPSMNMLNGSVDKNGLLTTNNGTQIQLPESAHDLAGQSDIIFGFRPEHTRMDGNGVSLGQATIRLIEPTGSETLLTTNLFDDSALVLDRDRRVLAAGETVTLSVLPSDLHFFNNKTGERFN